MLEKILLKLSDGEFHSGDELGETLGVTRTAVWKRIKHVRELGLPLISVKGKGYYIEGGLDLLSSSRVGEELTPAAKALISELEIFSVLASTNQRAIEKALPGCNGYVCTAEQQKAGRGRRGRAWVSPFAANIYFSVVWEFTGGAAMLEGLSLAVGVAAAEALSEVGVEGVRLKWPNDVLVGDKKLSGVLLEMIGDAEGPCRVIVGVGLNVAMPEGAGKLIEQPWTDIKSTGISNISRSKLLAVLLNKIMPMLAEYEGNGFGRYRDRWQALDAYKGQEVFIRHGDNVEYGVAGGVDSSGALILETAFGKKVYHGGEVSLRRAD